MSNFQGYNPDVLLCLANLSSDEVFTPPKIVNQILDFLPNDIWSNSNAKFLDPCCKSGVFLREIVKRLNNGLKKEITNDQKRLNHIFENQVYGIALTELTALISKRSLYCSKTANGKYSIFESSNDINGNIFYQNISHNWKNGKCLDCGASESNYNRGKESETYAYNFIHNYFESEVRKMKFDVIIGNPPYQLSDGGAQSSAIPIYQHFVENAKKLNPRYLTMIIPSRWFTSGKGLDEFREKMLSDKRITEIHDFHNASTVFPNVEIKGGVCYFLWERDRESDCKIVSHESDGNSDTMVRPLKYKNTNSFIRYNKAIPILEKITEKKEKTFDHLVSSRKPFGIETSFKNFKDKPFQGCLKIYANHNQGFVYPKLVKKNHEWIKKHKVIMPYAVGSGDPKTDKFKPIYSPPDSICTETYLVIGLSDNEKQAKNIISYIETRFFHFLVTLKKNTQHATKTVFEYVPQQDFTKPWTDEELYKKYNLSKDEINWINKNILVDRV